MRAMECTEVLQARSVRAVLVPVSVVVGIPIDVIPPIPTDFVYASEVRLDLGRFILGDGIGHVVDPPLATYPSPNAAVFKVFVEDDDIARCCRDNSLRHARHILTHVGTGTHTKRTTRRSKGLEIREEPNTGNATRAVRVPGRVAEVTAALRAHGKHWTAEELRRWVGKGIQQ